MRSRSERVWVPLWELLAERLASIGPENSVVFLTRVAAMAPGMFHMSMLLGKMQGKTKVATIPFYPGSIEGTTGLRFMDLKDRDALGKIEEIIQVDQADEQSVHDEITEYVATDSIREQYHHLLKAVADASTDPHESVGVWVSGFFGSGKSSFAKNLGYALENRAVLGSKFADLFKRQLGDRLTGDILDLINAKTPTQVILFEVAKEADTRKVTQRIAELIRKTLQNPPRDAPGLIVVTFFDGCPRIYSVRLTHNPIASPTENLWAGDQDNPAQVFIDYYYKRTSRTVEDALALGIHALRLANQLKAAYIGEPNAWVYRGGIFRRLTNAELTRYIDMSKALDASIASYAKNSPDH